MSSGCDWTHLDLCQKPQGPASLIKCMEGGCNRLLHHMCQCIWESKDEDVRQAHSTRKFCAHHHPALAKGQYHAETGPPSNLSLPSSTSSAGHTRLLSHYYGINGDSPNEQDCPTTILSRQFDGTQSLFEVAARLADGKDLLHDALTTITDKNATTKMTNIAIKVIKKSVLPLMDIASTQSRKTANLHWLLVG
jgi:hypothetical protein